MPIVVAGDYTLVTLDGDFRDISALHGAPPKVVWLRCGNQPTAVVADLLRGHAAHIWKFAAATDLDVLELG